MAQFINGSYVDNSPTLLSTDRGGPRTVANPLYVDPRTASYVKSAGATAANWTPGQYKSVQEFMAARPAGDYFTGKIDQGAAERGGQTVGPTYYANEQLAANTNAWQKYGVDNGFLPKDGGLSWGLKDAFLNPAVLAAVGGYAFAPAGGASAAQGAGMTTDEMIAAHGVQAGGAFAPTSAAALAPESIGAVGGAAAGVGASQGSSQAVDAETQDLIAAHGVQTGGTVAPAQPSTLLGSTPSAQGAVTGAAIPEAANNIGTAQAVDPIAAPTSEAVPTAPDVGSSPGSAGIGNGGNVAGGGTSPSTSLLTQASDMIGHINTFAQGALAIGGLLGGLAGLQGGKTPGSPEAPPPLPMGTQVGSQADVKAGLQAQGLPGGPLAGNASTWLTGASGVDPDKLNIGRSTLLGQ